MKIESDSGILEVNIVKRYNTECINYWDANWLISEVRIKIQGFEALYQTNLRVDEILAFYNDLLLFQKYQKQNVEFRTMEEGLYFNLVAEINGTISCTGKAKNMLKDYLIFNLDFDYATIDTLLEQLRKILKFYPYNWENRIR